MQEKEPISSRFVCTAGLPAFGRLPRLAVGPAGAPHSALRIPHFAPPRANSLSKQAIMISHRNSIVKPFLSTVVLACRGFRLLSAETHGPDGRFHGAPASRQPPSSSCPSGSSDRLHLGPARCRHCITHLVEVVVIVLDTAPPTVIRSGSASPCGTRSIPCGPPAGKQARRRSG
jgi:hypothetical protein